MILSEKTVKAQFSSKRWNQGVGYYKKKMVDINQVKTGYIPESEDPVCDVHATVKGSGTKQYAVSFMVYDCDIHNTFCNCSDFNSYYYGYRDSNIGCMHIVAASLEFIDYNKLHPVEMNTSKSVSAMITEYSEQSIVNAMTNHLVEKFDIEPKLEQDGEYCRISFRVGGTKKYVIKNLLEFCSNMEEGLSVTYGKDLELVHHMNSFTLEGQQFARFILSRVEENQLFMDQSYGGYYGKILNKRSMLLSPHSMDMLFPLILGKEASYSGRILKDDKAKMAKVHCVKDNPILKLWIRKLKVEQRNVVQDFVGVAITLEEAECFTGEQYLYIRNGDTLYQTDENYKMVMAPFLEKMSRLQTQEIKVGKEALGAFYSHVLGRIKEYVELIEDDGSEIEQYLPPEPIFHFYLDYISKENITCKVIINYGDKEFDPYKQEQNEDYVRDYTKELEAMLCVRTYLPYYDEKLLANHCDGDEDKIYLFLQSGLDELMALGEVKISDDFKRLHIKPSPKVSVGVSLESDLLNLQLSAENLDFAELADVLNSYRLRKKYHRLKNGDFLRMEENSLETLTELVDGLHISVKELTKGKMHIPTYRALYLDKVLQESEGVAYERDNHFKLMLRNFKAVEDSDYEVPTELKSTLRNYQKNGYCWLRTIDDYGFGGILADDMGLGKTLQVITLILAAKQEGKQGISLVVCPASLIYNWDSELRQFAPELRVKTITGTAEERKQSLSNVAEEDVLVTSYDLLKRDIEHYENLDFLYEIVDEAQYIKNHIAQSSKAVKLIHAKTRLALTGTPIENRLSELWSIFDYLMPGFLYRYDRFKKELETPITKDNDEIAVARLRKIVTPFIMRRLKKDVLKELPDKIEQVTYSRLEGEQLKLYDAYVAKVKQSLAGQSTESFQKNKLKVLADLTRLRQICCDPSLCYEEYKGDSAKLNTCMELIDSAVQGGHKVLIFSQFTSMLRIIAEKLREEKISYYEITGATAKEKRLQLVNNFNQDVTPIFLISLKAGGTGLNLTGADIVIHYDPWWNVAAQNQATDRAHRIGQKKVVTVFKLIAKGTIEEKILKLQDAKRDLADQIISGESSRLTTMSKDDFMELLH